MKAAIIYFSLEGNTELAALAIKKEIKAEVIKLILKEDFPKTKFRQFVKGGAAVLFKKKPPLFNNHIELDKYDTLFIGTPIWAGGFAPAIRTFISENKIGDKNIYLFTSSGGGSADKCFAKLEKILPGNNIRGKLALVMPSNMDPQTLKQKIHEFTQKIK